MSGEWQPIGKGLVLIGAALAGVGGLLAWGPRVPWLGHLPGDLAIKRDGVSVFFPITTCLVVSALLSLIFWLVSRFRP
jgi:hypothetical protein